MAVLHRFYCILNQARKVFDTKNDFILFFYINIQSNLDYSKCQGPHESFRIIGSSNDRKREFSDIFGKARILS